MLYFKASKHTCISMSYVCKKQHRILHLTGNKSKQPLSDETHSSLSCLSTSLSISPFSMFWVICPCIWSHALVMWLFLWSCDFFPCFMWPSPSDKLLISTDNLSISGLEPSSSTPSVENSFVSHHYRVFEVFMQTKAQLFKASLAQQAR